MKHTLFITQRCNLACRYCYIQKKNITLSLEMAEKIIDFIFEHTPENETVDIGFFGGEPLLEFYLLKDIAEIVINHPSYSADRVVLRLVSNGTLFSDEVAGFLDEYSIGFGISCDGPQFVHNKSRIFKNGKGTSKVVEENIKHALQWFPIMPVNAVYSTETVKYLPETIEYLSGLGVKNIHLNPDISSKWSIEDTACLEDIYAQIGQQYIDFYMEGDPRYISLIDSKITVILRGGYRPDEKCSMGKGELAYAPSGNIYPCERLVAGDDGDLHCLGNIARDTILSVKCEGPVGVATNIECHSCSLKEYCMNWCGCTNYFSTGKYNQVNHLICASEKAAIQTAVGVIEKTRESGISFSEHLSGTPLMSIIGEVSS